MKKRILSLFLCFVLCLSLCPTAAFADGEEGHTHEQQEETPLVVSATMSPEPTEAPAEPAPEPEEEPAEPTPEPTAAPEATQAPAEPAPEVETMPEPTAEPEIDSETDGVDEAVAAVQVLIDALPAVDSVSAEDYDAVQNAYDAYDALTAEQQALITGAEAFEALFNWLNEQVMELAEEHEHNYLNGICTAANYCYQPAEQDSDGYYQIGNAGQLYWFANWVNGGHPDSNAKLTGDIIVNSGEFDANGNCTGTDTPRKISWIGQSNYLYKGTFNGNKHTICGLYYKAGGKTGTVGLFRPNGATIQDLTIDNMYISAPQNIVGLIVENNCSVTVENVTVQNSYIISQNAGEVGAIVAKLKSGSVSNCRSINNVVQGKSNVGAIVGQNSGGTVKNCYSTNTFKSGNNTVSKVVGSGTAQNCYYLANEETTMQNGVAGKTAAQFKSGEVAYLLNGSKDNGTWKQTIGTDDFPGFTGGAVYRTSPCLTYTNDAGNLNKEHDKVKGTCTVCGEGCQHTNWTNGVCADCNETAVASMSKPGADTSYFMDLGKALLAAAADSGCTVAVLENVSSDVTVELSSYSANITLDLNGKTVTKLSYKYGGEICPLTVTDSASGGTLTELTLQSATATVTGGTVTTLNVTGGNVSISGGTVTAMNADNYAEVTISDGTVTALNAKDNAEVTISGGAVGTVTFQNGTLRDSDPSITLNVSGGTVTAITGDFGSKVAVSAGTVKTLNVKDGEVSLTGGSYERITGAETITLGDLLPVGKVFAKGSDIKPYSTALTSDGIDLTGYSITACEHDCELDDVGCCSGCGADREVIIVKANGGEIKYPTAAAAFAAAKEYTSATVTLRKDVHASETITLDKGTITLELGGHTLSGGDSKVLDLKGSATLIVNAALGGTIRNTYMGWNAPIAVSEKAKLTLANTQVTNDSDGDLTLGGGETTIEAGANIQVNVSISSGKLTVTGGTMTKLTARGGEVSLTGGTFDKIEVSGSGASCYSLLEEGYAFAQKSDGETLVDGTVAMLKNVTVVSHPAHNYDVETGKCACGLVRAAQIGKGDAAVVYSSLEAALEAAQNGDTITLLADVTAPRIGTGNNNQIDWSGKSGKITIDLNGKNLSCGGSLYIYGDVTITDSNTTNQGSVVVGTYLSSTQYVYVGESPKTGHLTIAGGNFSKVTLQKGTLNVSGGTISALSFSSGTNSDDKLTISGGTITTAYFNGPSEKTVSGGNIGTLELLPFCTNTTLSGGTVTTELKLYGGKADFGADFKFKKITADFGKLVDQLPTGKAFSIGETVKSADTDSIEAGENQYITLKGHDCNELDANGKCACGRSYEAKIEGHDFYPTLAAALNDATAGDTVKLLCDVTCNVIHAPNQITLDLNGKTISNEGNIYIPYTLTIKDSSEDKTGAIVTTGEDTSVIFGQTAAGETNETAMLTVNGGRFGTISDTSGSGGLTITGGTANITGGTFGALNPSAPSDPIGGVFATGGTVTVDGSGVKIDGQLCADNAGAVTLKNGTINVLALGGVGQHTIEGGTITGDTTIAHQGSGSATITGGSFQKLTISGDTNSIVTLKGGSFSEIQGAAKGSLLDCLGSDRAFWRSDGTSLKVVSGACKSLDAEAGISYSVSGHTCSKSDVKNGKCDCGRVYEACIGDTFYASFEAAVTAAGSGDVITLLVDLAALPQMKAGFDPIEPAALVEDDGSSAEGEGPADYSIFQPGKNVTIDLNGYSITGESPLYLIGSMTITDSTTTGAAGTVGGSTTSIIIGGGSVTLMGRASIPGVVKVAGAGCYPSDYAIVGTDYSAGELIVNGGSAATVELAAGGTVRMTGGAVTMLDVTGNGVLTVTDGTVETLKVERENATVILSGGEFKTIQSTGRTLPKLLASNYAYAIKTGTGDPEITAKLYDVNTYSCADGQSVTVVLHTSHTPSEAASDAVTTRCACGQSLTLAITNGDSTTYFTDFDANALSNLRSGGTAKLISNTHLTTNVTMPETSFTLDLNGFNISDGGYKKSITVPEGSAMTLTVGNSPQGKSNSSVIPPITVNGELTVVGDVAVNSIGCEPNGKLTAGNDSDTAQPTISTLTVHGNPAGRVALKNGVELMNICFGTGETYTLLDLLGAGQAFFAEDGNPIEANVNSHSSAMVTVGAHTSCDYTSGTNGHCACGRACPHDTFDDATGKCDDCHAQMAAKIVEGGVLGVGATTTYFSSFADAVKAAQSGNTITLLTAAASTESAVSFPAGIYTIDLNGKTIGCALTLDFGADVTVKDGTKTDSAKLSRKMSILNVTGEILVKAGDAGAGKLTLKNGVRTAKVVLHNIEGGQRNGMLAVDTGASINELHVRGDHGMALGIDNETLNLSGTDITLGEVSQGSMLNLGAGATVGDITMASASTLEITGGTADEVNVMALGSVRMTGGKVEAMIIEAIPQDESTAKLEYFDISGGEIGALTLGDTGVTMYTSIQKGLTGGSYGKIELKGGATGISLYDLLGENRAFYATDSGLRVEVQGKETGNVTVKAPCAHYDKIDAAGLCSECAIQHVAKVTKADGTLVGWYETLFLAVGQATGGIVTLVADVPAATNNDASLLEATYTIDLNGHKIGINLTVPEVANVTLKGDAPGSAVTGKITMEEVEGSKAPAGALTIESGTYKEIEAQAGALNVTGGTITKLTENGGNVKLSGGHFEKIETCTEGKAVRDLLKSGYAFKKDDAFVLWGNADINSSLCSDVDVAACVHQAIVLGNECLYCGKPLVAQLVADDETSFYTSFEAAYAAVPATGESVITLLRDSNDSSATHQVNKTFRLLLGGHELKDKLDIVAGGCLTVANSSGSTLDAIEQTGGTLKVNADAQAVIKELTVSGGETQLSGGTYNSITVTAAGKTVGDLLAENSAYYQTAAGGGKIWLTVANETALQNVSVGRIPLLDITLTASPESLTYGGVLTLTASRVYDADYKWFEVVNGAETAIATPEPDPNPNTRTLTPDAGSHTYRCKVTKDGYTVTLDKTVTVAKADIDFITPKPKTSLIYNGGAQELILAGDTRPSGCTIQYKLGADGTYGTDASALKGTDAKTYTVYYYVDGGTNYNSIGSADKPREIKVTIAPRDLDRTDTRYVSISSGVDLTYNGQQQTPEFTLTLNSCDDPTSPSLIETLTLGTDYTQSVKKKTDVGTYTAELKGKGNYTGTKTVDWNIKKAPAPTAADGTLLVYNQVARSYTFDFASLLPTLPKGCEYGKLSYALNAVGTEANTSVITAAGYLGDYSLAQSTLTLPVNAVNSSAVDTIAKLRVTVTSDNYENITLTLNVDRINRASPVDVAAPVEGLTKDNVTSDSREALETLRDDLADYLASDPLDDEREELEDLQETVDELLKQLDEAKAAMEDDAIGAADDIDASNAKPGHKGKLRSAKKAAQAALEKFGPNYTAKEKAALNDTIARIDAALAAIDKAESDANKPVKTGDESMPILWIVLLVAAAGCVVILLAARKKKK